MEIEDQGEAIARHDYMVVCSKSFTSGTATELIQVNRSFNPAGKWIDNGDLPGAVSIGRRQSLDETVKDFL
jgi:hypothetical protein